MNPSNYKCPICGAYHGWEFPTAEDACPTCYPGCCECAGASHVAGEEPEEWPFVEPDEWTNFTDPGALPGYPSIERMAGFHGSN